MVEAAIACVILATVTSCFSSPRIIQEAPIATSLLIVMLIHTEFSGQVETVTVAGLFLVNLVPCIRLSKISLPNRWVMAALGWWWGMQAIHASESRHFLADLLMLVATICFAGHVSALGRRAFRPLALVAGVVIIVNFISGVRERGFGDNAVWPRRDGVTFTVNGTNSLWEGAGGRMLGTMGWAITLGVVCATLVIFSAWLMWTKRSVYWGVVTCLGLTVVVLSGTRTAVLMLALAGVLALMFAVKRVVLLAPLAALVLVIAAGSVVSLRSLAGFGVGTADTKSIEHRSAIWKAVPDLLSDRSFVDVAIGNGYRHASEMLQSDVVPDVGSVGVYDNEVARSLIGIGLIGLLLFLIAAGVAMRRSGRLGAILTLTLLLSSLSYDILTWSSIYMLLVFCLGLRTTPDDSAGADGSSDAAESNEPGAGSQQIGPSRQAASAYADRADVTQS